jgi:hypothetical protein
MSLLVYPAQMMSGTGVTAMIVRHPGLRMSMIAALVGGIALAATGAEPPADHPCQKLTGVERTQCEQRNREREKDKAPTAAAEPAEPPPPDTKSEGNEQSDTADPPQG